MAVCQFFGSLSTPYTPANANSSSTERLWKEYFSDASQWVDTRNSKTHPRAPDFKHRTKESLWIDGSSWTKMETVDKAMHAQLPELASLELMPYPPSLENLACILRKCRKHKDPAYALRLHNYLRNRGLETHKSLGNYLVPLLVENGSLLEAQHVFDRLVDPNEHSWTSLITGYVECGELHLAFELHQKMQDDCVRPSEYTFVPLLKACARLKDTDRGCGLHAEITRMGLLERHPFVGNTLVDMYAKCGWLAKAQDVFDKLPVRDVVSWNALITGYTEHDRGHDALNSFEQMELEGVSPSAVTFICSLKACGSIGDIDKGQEIHAEIAGKGLLETHPFIGNTLIGMYAKCGLLAKAHEVFDKLPVRDAISWNALIAGYAEHNLGHDALDCFDQMQLEGVSPDVVTFVFSFKACGSIGAIGKGQAIHAEIAGKGMLETDPFVGNTLVDMYAKCGLLAKAQDVFDKLPVHDAVSWNALITGYAEHALGHGALNCFEQMQLEGISPDAVTFISSLKACGSIGAIGKGQELNVVIAGKGLLETHPLVGSTLVGMYAKSGFLAKAHDVFDKLPVRDAVLWSVLITEYAEQDLGHDALNCFEQMQLEGISPSAVSFICSLKACGSIGALGKGKELHAEIAGKGLLETHPFVGSTLVDMYAKCGLLAKAYDVFDKLPVRNAVSWTALIAGYAEHGLGHDALNCFEQMQLEGVSPNAVTFICSLKACGSIGAIDRGQEIHAEIAGKGLLETHPLVGSTLVDMYAKCGLLAKANEVFDKLPLRDAVSWTALIAGYAQLGESENVFFMLDRMRAEGLKPDGITFLTILTVCSHTGLVEKGQTYFEAMSKDYGITPTIEHHNCMVDLLGRSGFLEEAAVMIKKMPFKPGLTAWHALLGACRKWGNVELGKWAFEQAVELDRKDAAAYVLMSNIYADAHMQENAKQVDLMRLKEQEEART